MSLLHTIEAMELAGVSAEQILDAVKAIALKQDVDAEERKETLRAAARERKAKSRAAKALKNNNPVTNVTVTSRDTCDIGELKEIPPTPPKENTPSQKKNPPKGGQKEKGFPVAQAVEAWNEVCVPAGMPKCLKLTDKRARQIGARLADHGEQEWREACQRLARSAFCRGKNNTGWVATIDFLSTPDGFVKAMEGKYDDRATTSDDQARRDIWRERIAETQGGGVQSNSRPRLAFSGSGPSDPVAGGACAAKPGADRADSGDPSNDLWGRQA